MLDVITISNFVSGVRRPQMRSRRSRLLRPGPLRDASVPPLDSHCFVLSLELFRLVCVSHNVLLRPVTSTRAQRAQGQWDSELRGDVISASTSRGNLHPFSTFTIPRSYSITLQYHATTYPSYFTTLAPPRFATHHGRVWLIEIT